MSLTFLDVVGHTSFLLTALSFYVRDMIVLRCLAIVSGVVGVAYNYWLPAGPLWLVIFWLTVFVLINLVRIVGIVLDRRSIAFNEEEAELHETVFQNFSPVEFRKLMRIGDWRNAEQGEQLTVQGSIVGGLNLLFNGEVRVERDGEEVGRARDGAMIGEISFIQGGAATATVSATKPCRYIAWSGDELRKLLHRNPSMDVAMKHVFSVDLMRKLTV
ncbi:MAG: cyclic nucleotide-binding domain-containing protein [Alphaproteobacteria bacterium]|nr:cyclic nucleotide-binding domain-containing protein [Alphaproteobacteria bacterium]